jgi:hypothetical protein
MKEFIKKILRENVNDIELGSKDDVKYADGVVMHTYSDEIEVLKNKCKLNNRFCNVYDDFVEAIVKKDINKINRIIKIYFPNKLNEGILVERLMDIDDDVDLIYDKYFKEYYDNMEKTGKMTYDMFKLDETDTSILKSPLCIEAHKLNPCVIRINNGSNYYDPEEKIISVSFSNAAKNFVFSSANGNINHAINLLDDSQKKSLSREFKESTIKGSIHHELVHWLDDTMHNYHIKNRIKKQILLKTRDLKGIPVNASKMELQSQIHNIKQLKRKHEDVWDDLSFDDMISLSPSLTIINKSLIDPYKSKWRIDIIKRMNRENLLGNNMVK